jgi:hypothetical protein
LRPKGPFATALLSNAPSAPVYGSPQGFVNACGARASYFIAYCFEACYFEAWAILCSRWPVS